MAIKKTPLKKPKSQTEVLKKWKELNERRHFLFGYGSLICPESRAITAPSLAAKIAMPCLVQNVERTWTARVKSGMTAMGVRFQEGAECTGVLLEVDEEEIAMFDKREKNYDRVKLHLDNIEEVPDLDTSDGENDNIPDASTHAVFEAKERDAHDDVHVWIYVQKKIIPADTVYPIAQSYVDIIMRGCLEISEDFARSFIETTTGWDTKDENWVDDREDPIYVRADTDFSEEHGANIDQLLSEHLPDELIDNRLDKEDFDRGDHEEQLEEHQERVEITSELLKEENVDLLRLAKELLDKQKEEEAAAAATDCTK